jgi:hypothetical protein
MKQSSKKQSILLKLVSHVYSHSITRTSTQLTGVLAEKRPSNCMCLWSRRLARILPVEETNTNGAPTGTSSHLYSAKKWWKELRKQTGTPLQVMDFALVGSMIDRRAAVRKGTTELGQLVSLLKINQGVG